MVAEGFDTMLFRPLSRQIARAFTIPIFQVEAALADDVANRQKVANFMLPEGPSKLLVYLQPREATSAGEDDDADEPNIFVSSGETDRFVDRGVLLVKLKEGAALTSPAAIDTEVTCTVVLGSPVKSLLSTLEHVFQPALTASVSSWGQQLPGP